MQEENKEFLVLQNCGLGVCSSPYDFLPLQTLVPGTYCSSESQLRSFSFADLPAEKLALPFFLQDSMALSPLACMHTPGGEISHSASAERCKD